MKAVIDTNVLIFDYVENSEFHKEAESLLDSLNSWVIPSIVIHEFVWFLRKNNLESHIHDIFAYIENEKSEISYDTEDIIKSALEILMKEKLSISYYNDIVVLSHALKKNLPLVTFDKELRKISKRYKVETLP